VAIAYPATVPWMALFLRGVAAYADRHGHWNLMTSPPTLAGAEETAQTIHDLRGWLGDGVMAAINSPTDARAARRLRIPVVNFSGAMRLTSFPRVTVDNRATGRVAAEHLLARGHRRLAYYGIRGVWYSEQRRLGFVERAQEAGAECDVFETSSPAHSRGSWRQRIAPLTRWLQGLKPPVGLLAVQDYRARVVLDECLRLGMHVPHDVAILGVDNDPTVCEFCRPTLSSVSRDAWRMGYEAAAMLDVLMSGKSPPEDDVLIPPGSVAARQSTDTVAVDDPHLAAAIHYMRDHVAEPFGMERVMRHATISRRQLELRFRRHLQTTPHDYLCRVRVERARQLLASPERIKMQAIAAECGFTSVEHMRIVFRRVTGQTPSGYRRKVSDET
jgi:LacI family transcriptional regulator